VGRTHSGRRFALNADPTSQARLLELQGLDSTLDRLDHRRRTLPEAAAVAEIERRIADANDALVSARTRDADLAREQAKVEADVETVRARTERDQKRLDDGNVASPRELENLQSEIASLRRRRSELEDQILQIMEQREALQAEIDALTADVAKLEGERAELIKRRDQLLAEIDTEAATTKAARDVLAPQLPAELLGLYERLRASLGGVGAAALHRGQCQGCHLTLNPADLQRIRAAAPDEVVRCEECGRILVRTPESGL